MLEKIKFSYNVAETQQGLCTPSHRKYNCIITYNHIDYRFDYQCNPNHMLPNVKDCIDSLLLDCFAYDVSDNIVGFSNDCGYIPYEKEAQIAYNACKKTSKAIHKMFTDDELSELQDELNDY